MSTPPAPLPPPEVVAVIVTYGVDAAALRRLLARLQGEVAAAVVVDNASPGWRDPAPALPLRVLRLDRNQGLAAAQNLGVDEARRWGATQVLLLDQDSLPEPGLAATLQAALRRAQAQGLRVAAVGPDVLHDDGHSDGFVRFRDGRYRPLRPRPGDDWIDCDMLIASGSLLTMAALDDIGPMAAELFIDKVDTEWSLRAAARGWCILGVPAARLQHRLGERRVRLWLLGWRELPLHRPFRYYYMVRNSLLVGRLPHAHAAWRRAERRQMLSLLVYFGLLAPGRLANLRMMLRGLLDGLRGRGGPLVRA